MENFLNDFEKPVITYAGFWPRLGALIIDGLVLAPVTVPLSIINITTWKSIPVLVLVSFLPLFYKPFMEYKWGATIGKKATGIKVINYSFQKPTLQNALFRNIIQIVTGLGSFFISLTDFQRPGFKEVSSFIEYSTYNAQQNGWENYYSILILVIYLVDAIFMWTDEQKRSLHDRIGSTYVVKK